ncbi:hypothetical protein ND2E_3800 [Colwellia psychrerythraea]|uniref:Uncharacterized protein n=2 Tax=Colwellia psychrerythraea TaxID=28229 RepID=A0A099KFV1_COLPS|nr:hypothetical protein ND2E_3800 [Colwellia psychrerythraea]
MSISERLKYFCYVVNVCRSAHIKPCGYQLQKALAQLPKDLNDSDIRNNKWDRYFSYPTNKTPNAQTLLLISTKFKQCNYILDEPFWEVLSELKDEPKFYIDFLLKTPPTIRGILFDKRNPYTIKTNLNPRDFQVITKQRSLTALAVLLSLIKLHQHGFICISHITALVLEILSLLTICSISAPLDLIPKESYDLIVKFMLGNSELADNLLDTKTASEHIKRLEYLSTVIRTMCLYGSSANESVLVYWLLKADEKEIKQDFENIRKGVALTDNTHGILCVLNQTMADVKTNIRDKTHLQFMFDLFTSNRQLEV